MIATNAERIDVLWTGFLPKDVEGFVRIRTSLKNRVHALLTMEGVQPPAVSDLFGKKGLKFLETVKIRESRRLALDNYLKVLDELNERITEVEQFLEEEAESTDEVNG